VTLCEVAGLQQSTDGIMDQTRTPRTALELGDALQSRTLDAERLTAETLAAIAAVDMPGLFTRIGAERARTEAKAAAVRLAAGKAVSPLDGVPIAWKDLFDLAGEVTTAGSRVLAATAPAQHDAPVVAALKNAGMVAVGCTGMTEFAFSGLGLNPHYGTPRNPWSSADAPRIPGGSSSGSAVAVAMGLVPAAIGTDTGGSVRIPAAFNGIVGYKATHGRYPMDGVFPLAPSLDSLGTFTHDVADAIAIDAAMRDAIAAPAEIGLKDVTLVVPVNVVFDNAEPGVTAAFEAALQRLDAAGVTIERRVFSPFDGVMDLLAQHGPLVGAEAYQVHAARLADPDEVAAMDRRVASRLAVAGKIAKEAIAAFRAGRRQLIAEARGALGPRVMLVHPTVPHVAPLTKPLEQDDALYLKMNGLTLRNTTLGNILEFCGVSLPCGTGEAEMPVGFLISASGGLDAEVLAVAQQIEEIVRAG
jgi:aspartyl-tRNA(Asn)/glutamyl-tRNA(Gln) amidotransferase subunit A